jgi:TonB family protein
MILATKMAGTFTIEGSPKVRIPRRCARLRVESLIYLDLGPENGGFPVNISEEGMAFQGIRPLQKDEEICIAFKLDGIREPVTAIARIVWLTESRKAGALQFVDLPEASRNHIRQWIELQRKAESPQHSAEMKISPGKPRPRPQEAVPVPVLAAVSIYSAKPALTSTSTAPASPASPALAPAPPRSDGEPAQPLEPYVASVATKPQGDGKQSPPAQPAHAPENRQPSPPASVPLSPRRVKWTWSISYGLGLAACVGMAVVAAALLWPYRATIIERLHGSDSVKSVSPSTPAASVPELDKPPAQPPSDLPMTDPAQWVPIGSALQNPPTPPPVDISLKAPARVVKDAAPSALSMNSRKASQTPAPPAKGSRAQATSPAFEPAKSRQPAAAATPAVESANDLPASGAASAKAAVPEPKAPAIPVVAAGSVEIISDPYPSIRMPASSQGPASRLGTSLQIGRLASKVEPIYPVEALRQKIAGTVKLHVVIGTNGAVQSAEVADGPALLADSALRAVEQWRYDPTMLGGTAIEVEEGVTLVFRIANSPAPAN